MLLYVGVTNLHMCDECTWMILNSSEQEMRDQ